MEWEEVMKDRRRRVSGVLGAAACALLGVALPTIACGQTPYFKGNQVFLVVASDVGGGYDTYARLLSRHIGRHLPGTPFVVVQNMPGAGSLKAMDYIVNWRPRTDPISAG
jgi:tripartite-type tricarboxylate transporter receptor subunit TctC